MALYVDAASLQTVGKWAVCVVELVYGLVIVDGQVRESDYPALGVAVEGEGEFGDVSVFRS